MPNHVTNEIKVIGGTNKQRLAFMRSITNKRGLIDFNCILQMPKSLNIAESTDVERMASAIAGKPMCDFWFGDLQTEKQVTTDLRARGAKAGYIQKVRSQALTRIENKRIYGFYSWYDWSRVNWGTKWNAYGISMPVSTPKQRVKRGYQHRKTHVRAYAKRLFKKTLYRHAASGAELVIRFETAWSCPEPVYRQMAIRFPHLEFHIRYADEDSGSNCGAIILQNGEWSRDDIAPRWSDQTEVDHLKWRKFAFEVHYPGDTPQQHSLNDQYEYEDDE